jgi:hypothetical protein
MLIQDVFLFVRRCSLDFFLFSPTETKRARCSSINHSSDFLIIFFQRKISKRRKQKSFKQRTKEGILTLFLSSIEEMRKSYQKYIFSRAYHAPEQQVDRSKCEIREENLQKERRRNFVTESFFLLRFSL